MKNFHEPFFSKVTIKSKKWSKRAENGRKRAKNVKKHFFWKKLFCYFFITYQELTRWKKSKNSNERILRSGERTNERTNGRTELRRQIYRTNLQSRWLQKTVKFGWEMNLQATFIRMQWLLHLLKNIGRVYAFNIDVMTWAFIGHLLHQVLNHKANT